MTTHIKIDFDDAGKATHVRVTRDGVQALLPGATCDLSALDALLKLDPGAIEVAASVEQALTANQITLVEAARIRKREEQLDAGLVYKRQQVAEYDAALRDRADALAIVDKQQALDVLTRDVAEIVAIVDKTAALATLTSQVEAKAAELDTLTPAEPDTLTPAEPDTLTPAEPIK